MKLLLDKRLATQTLTEVAYDVWAEAVERARKRSNDNAARRLTADAKRCLEAALRGIEKWLDAVYERGIQPEEADSDFLGSLDACRGLDYLTPGDLIPRERS